MATHHSRARIPSRPSTSRRHTSSAGGPEAETWAATARMPPGHPGVRGARPAANVMDPMVADARVTTARAATAAISRPTGSRPPRSRRRSTSANRFAAPHSAAPSPMPEARTRWCDPTQSLATSRNSSMYDLSSQGQDPHLAQTRDVAQDDSVGGVRGNTKRCAQMTLGAAREAGPNATGRRAPASTSDSRRTSRARKSTAVRGAWHSRRRRMFGYNPRESCRRVLRGSPATCVGYWGGLPHLVATPTRRITMRSRSIRGFCRWRS